MSTAWCYCEGWMLSHKSFIDVFVTAHKYGTTYTGEDFYFCPWCAEPLLTEEQKKVLGLCKHGLSDWSECPDCGH